jgi:2'-5' RNA ligase
MGTIRTFIALAMPEAVCRDMHRLQADIARDIPRGIRWVGPEAMHLTIRFLGATGAALVPAIAGALDAAVRDVPPVRFTLAGLGAFPSAGNPKVVWAGFDDGGAAARVHHALEDALERLGCAREPRPYAPHLTLGRIRDFRVRKDLARVLARRGGTPFGTYTAARVVFYHSELTPSGARYRVLHERSLAGSAGTR